MRPMSQLLKVVLETYRDPMRRQSTWLCTHTFYLRLLTEEEKKAVRDLIQGRLGYAPPVYGHTSLTENPEVGQIPYTVVSWLLDVARIPESELTSEALEAYRIRWLEHLIREAEEEEASCASPA